MKERKKERKKFGFKIKNKNIFFNNNFFLILKFESQTINKRPYLLCHTYQTILHYKFKCYY